MSVNTMLCGSKRTRLNDTVTFIQKLRKRDGNKKNINDEFVNKSVHIFFSILQQVIRH